MNDENKESKETVPARDRVELKKIDTTKQRQEVDEEKISQLMEEKRKADEILKEEDAKLNPLHRMILTSFQKDRMILLQLIIVINQTRKVMGQGLFTEETVKAHCDELVEWGFCTHQSVEFQGKTNEVYIITDKGKELAF